MSTLSRRNGYRRAGPVEIAGLRRAREEERMLDFEALPGTIRFLDEGMQVSFSETSEPVLSREHPRAIDDLWQEWVERNPTMFDGPVVAITAITQPEPGTVEFAWTRTTYRRHLLRHVPGAVPLVPVFVAVAQPTEAGILLGRMAD